ncbi:hypothetical protein TNCV_3832231 [Trichonephila clavipes]|nr:hypothetical protein TNCV_3832231 [Trichonephila clavipes]
MDKQSRKFKITIGKQNNNNHPKESKAPKIRTRNFVVRMTLFSNIEFSLQMKSGDNIIEIYMSAPAVRELFTVTIEIKQRVQFLLHQENEKRPRIKCTYILHQFQDSVEEVKLMFAPTGKSEGEWNTAGKTEKGGGDYGFCNQAPVITAANVRM